MSAKIYAHRSKEDNLEIVEAAIERNMSMSAVQRLKYLGSEIEFDISIDNEGRARVLALNGINLSEEVYI